MDHMEYYTTIVTAANQSLDGLIRDENITQELDYNASDGYGDSDSISAGTITFKLVMVLIGVIGIVGNTLVTVIIGCDTSMRQDATNCLIIHQSIVDLVSSIYMLCDSLMVIENDNVRELSGYIFCFFFSQKCVVTSTMWVSTYNLVMINIERCLKLVMPIWHTTYMSVNKVGVLIFFV